MLGGDMNIVSINHHDGTKTITKEADDNTWDGLWIIYYYYCL